VNVLPFLDPYMMAYRNRNRYLQRSDHHHTYDRGGNVTQTILVDGRIAGTWDIDKNEATVKYHLFRQEEESCEDAIQIQVKATEEFITGTEVTVRRCYEMTPLNERNAGGFMTPLKKTLTPLIQGATET
jgi:hypothetical protein